MSLPGIQPALEPVARDASSALGGIVLAAGASRRAGYPKPLGTLGGEALVARIARTLAEGGCAPIAVVLGAPYGAAVEARLPEGAHVVWNAAPERGMLSSLSRGLELAEALGWDAAVVALVDHPHVLPCTVAALVAAWHASGADLVRPVHQDRAGHPYLVSRALFAKLRRADPDEGARPVLAQVRHRIDVPVSDAGVLEDADLPADLALAGVEPPSRPVPRPSRS